MHILRFHLYKKVHIIIKRIANIPTTFTKSTQQKTVARFQQQNFWTHEQKAHFLSVTWIKNTASDYTIREYNS